MQEGICLKLPQISNLDWCGDKRSSLLTSVTFRCLVSGFDLDDDVGPAAAAAAELTRPENFGRPNKEPLSLVAHLTRQVPIL